MMFDMLGRTLSNLMLAPFNFGQAILHPELWLNWSDRTALTRFIYYGGSSELLYFVLFLFFAITVAGLWKRGFLWLVVRVLEAFANSVGRVAAWAGLIMVLQQVMVVFLQRVFTVSQVSISPFGFPFSKDLSWFGEELKLYNAIVVCMCCSYTFVQGGHVRVDLFYAGISYRAKRIVDMFGSLFFIVPTMCLIWMYGWFFLWRHLVTPKISVTDKLELLERKARLLKWNVETIGFSPSGFDAYFLFKMLLVIFAGMMLVHGIAFFFRSLLEYLEGPESEGKYLDRDRLDDVTASAVQQNT